MGITPLCKSAVTATTSTYELFSKLDIKQKKVNMKNKLAQENDIKVHFTTLTHTHTHTHTHTWKFHPFSSHLPITPSTSAIQSLKPVRPTKIPSHNSEITTEK